MAEKRINKILSELGVCSRRAADELIHAGKVKVNGSIVTELGAKADPEIDIILVQGRPLPKQPKKILLRMHKPKGFETSCVRRDKEKIVTDLIPSIYPRLYPIGRLDKDTTGLLLFTNDGDFANKMMHPSSEIEREYSVKVKEEILPMHIRIISAGMRIEGRHVKPKKVLQMHQNVLHIVVMEGRNREVRRFLEKARLSIIELKRIRFGKYTLGRLPLGSIDLEKK